MLVAEDGTQTITMPDDAIHQYIDDGTQTIFDNPYATNSEMVDIKVGSSVLASSLDSKQSVPKKRFNTLSLASQFEPKKSLALRLEPVLERTMDDRSPRPQNLVSSF